MSTQSPNKWSKLTVADLKEELHKRDLPVSGRKSELIDRLLLNEIEEAENDNAEVDQTTETAPDEESEQMEPENDVDLTEEIEAAENGDELLEDLVDEEHVEDGILDEASEEEGDLEIDGEDDGQMSEEIKQELDQEADEESHETNENDVKMEVKEEVGDQTFEQGNMSATDMIVLDELDDEIKPQLQANAGPESGEEDTKPQQDDKDMNPDIEGDKKPELEEAVDVPVKQEVAEPQSEVGEPQSEGGEQKPAEEMEVTKPEEEAKTGEESSENQTEPKNEVLPPLPFSVFTRWMTQQLQHAQKNRTWKVKGIKSKDDLLSVFTDLAKLAVEFSVNYLVNGNGVAMFKFLTEGQSKQGQEILSQTFSSENVTKVNEYNSKDSESLKVASSTLAGRTLVVKGIPRGTPEEEVSTYFPAAKVISKHEKKRDGKLAVPENLEDDIYVQFPDRETALSSLKAGAEFTEKFENGLVQEMRHYMSDYRKWEDKQMQTYEEKIKQESMSKVFSDEERIEMCRALKTILIKMETIKSTDKDEKEKLRQRMSDIRKAIDADTSERIRLKLKFPEPVKLMTTYTRESYLKEANKKPASRDKRRDDPKSDSRHNKDQSDSRASEKGRPSRKEDDNVKEQLGNLHADARGLYTISILRDQGLNNYMDIKRIFRRFGTIQDSNMTYKRVYVRFSDRSVAETVVKELGMIPRYELFVPVKNKEGQKRQRSASPKDTKSQKSSKDKTSSEADKSKTEDKAEPPPSKQAKSDETEDKKEATENDMDVVKDAELKTDDATVKADEKSGEKADKTEEKKEDKAVSDKVSANTEADKVEKKTGVMMRASVKEEGEKLTPAEVWNYGPTSSKPSKPPQPVAVSKPDVTKKPTGKVYLKNVRKGTSKRRLDEVMSKFGPVLSVKIENHKAQLRSTAAVVMFENPETVQKVLAAKQEVIDYNKVTFHPVEEESEGSAKTETEGKETTPSKDQNNTTDNSQKSVFVRNINPRTTENSLLVCFANIGPVASVEILKDKKTKKSKGLAIVEFKGKNAAQKALRLASIKLDGKLLLVEPKMEKTVKEPGATPLGEPVKKVDATSAQKTDKTSDSKATNQKQTTNQKPAYQKKGVGQAVQARQSAYKSVKSSRTDNYSRSQNINPLMDTPVSPTRDRHAYSRNLPMHDPARDRHPEDGVGSRYYEEQRREQELRSFYCHESDGDQRRAERARDVDIRAFQNNQQDKYRYEEEQNRYSREERPRQMDTDSRVYYEDRYGSESSRSRYDEKDRYRDQPYSRDHSRESAPDRYASDRNVQQQDARYLDSDRYDTLDRYQQQRQSTDLYDRRQEIESKERDYRKDLYGREAEKRKHAYEEPRAREDYGMRSDGRGYSREHEDALKRRRMAEEVSPREDEKRLETDSVANVLLKTIGDVISSKMDEFGKRDQMTHPAETMKSLPSDMGISSSVSAPKVASVGSSQLLQQQQQVLQQQHVLHQQKLKEQQAMIQKQQQQLLLRKQQEQQLQKELMELQKMKEAALREAQASNYQRR